MTDWGASSESTWFLSAIFVSNFGSGWVAVSETLQRNIQADRQLCYIRRRRPGLLHSMGSTIQCRPDRPRRPPSTAPLLPPHRYP